MRSFWTLSMIQMALISSTSSFSTISNSRSRRGWVSRLYYTEETADGPSATATLTDPTPTSAAAAPTSSTSKRFPDAPTIDFALDQHRPLGCSVEESIAAESNDDLHVFISKIVDGGFAQQAGMEIGDVLVGVTGTFGSTTDVGGAGMDVVKRLISAVHPTDPLHLRVARGTDVMERHETTIVDLCVHPTGMDQGIDECIDIIHSLSWEEDDVDDIVPCDDEEECLLDDMFNMWAEDLPQPTVLAPEEEPETKKKQPAPWSSRSSGSGTYVRDPATGVMRNIDEDY